MPVSRNQNNRSVPAGPGRPKDDRKAAAILEAAGNLFIRHGLSRVTMDTVAREAGVSKLTVYNHFGNKDQLFETVIRSKCESYMRDDLLAEMDGRDPLNELRVLGQAFVNIIYDDEALAMHRTVMSESRNNQKIARLFYRSAPERVFEQMEAYLGNLERFGQYHFPDVHRAADIFFSLFQGDTHMRTALGIDPKPRQAALEKLARDNAALFLKMFATQPRAEG